MIRKVVNYVLTLIMALVPTVWLGMQIRDGEVNVWLVVFWTIVMAFAIAITYGKEEVADENRSTR